MPLIDYLLKIPIKIEISKATIKITKKTAANSLICKRTSVKTYPKIRTTNATMIMLIAAPKLSDDILLARGYLALRVN